MSFSWTDKKNGDIIYAKDINSIANETKNKVDKEDGKGLSANDYTDSDKAKVDDLPGSPGAEIEARAYKLYVEEVENSLKAEVTQRKTADKEIESKLSEKADTAYVDDVKTKTVPRVSATGSGVLRISDALGGEKLLGCRVWGNCGKNLFDSTQLSEAAGWTCTDGVYSGKAGDLYHQFTTLTGGFYVPYTGGQLAISLEGKNASKEVITFYFWIHYTDGTKQVICPVQSTEWTKFSGVTHANKTIEKIQCGYSNNDTIYLRNIQIESGDTCTDYEEFTGLGEAGANGYFIPLECGAATGIPEVSVINIGNTALNRGEYIDLITCKRYDAKGTESGDITFDTVPTIPEGGYAVIGTSMTNGITPERIEAEYILKSGRYAPLDENGKIPGEYLYGETVKQYGVRFGGTSSTVCERLGDTAGLEKAKEKAEAEYTESQMTEQEITDLMLESIEQGQQITELELMILGGTDNV